MLTRPGSNKAASSALVNQEEGVETPALAVMFRMQPRVQGEGGFQQEVQQDHICAALPW